MTLPIIFLALAAAIAGLLYAVSLVLQSYFYESPADRLPLRALAGGILAAAFLCLWVNINTKASSKDKYGTLFEFNATPTREFQEFTATRWHIAKDAEGKHRESKAKFVKVQKAYVENGDTGKPFRLTNSDWLVTSIEIPDGDQTIVLNAELFVPKEGQTGELRPWQPGDEGSPVYSRDLIRVFREADGRRSVEFTQLGSPGALQMPSRGGFIGAILINIAQFVVWFVIFWPVLRFTSGPALGLALAATVVVMLFVMPLLFNRYKAPAPPPAVAYLVPTSVNAQAEARPAAGVA